MNYLAYANKNNINIIPQDAFSQLTRDVFNVVADNLSRSLGPLGSSAIIFDGAISESTKDGFSILKKYTFTSLYKQMVLNMIKRPCMKMNNTVGDGTTTAIVLAQRIYEIYQSLKPELDGLYTLPRDFTKTWDATIEKIQERMKEMKRPMDVERGDVYNIAYVSSNGNKEVSKEIEKVYKENQSPYIHIKDSGTNKSYLKAVSGFEFPANLISEFYARTDDGSIDFSEPMVMIFDHSLNVNNFQSIVIPLLELCRRAKKELVVVAPLFENKLCDGVLEGLYNYECENFATPTMFPVQYSTGDLKDHQLEDLGAVLNCRVITKELEETLIEAIESNKDIVWEENEDSQSQYYRTFGTCKKMSTSCKNGSIFEVDEMCEYHQNSLKAARRELEDVVKGTLMEEQNLSLKAIKAQERVTRLEMNNYIYYIGADSELQKQILRDAVDDTVKCLRSAASNGVVPGCQITLYRAAKEIAEDLSNNELTKAISTIIYKAAEDVYKKVLCGPDMMTEDPEVVLNRLKDCSSIEREHVDWEELLGMVLDDIVQKSSENNLVYDLELMMYSDRVITSAETDSMVLSSASELVKILIAGNQCVYVDPFLNAKDEKEVYQF